MKHRNLRQYIFSGVDCFAYSISIATIRRMEGGYDTIRYIAAVASFPLHALILSFQFWITNKIART